MSQPHNDATLEFRPTAENPTLTRVGDGEPASRSVPANFIPPGYEILGELGRGGMGVVYRALQKSLNRQVALKVILGAGHAGGESLARFRAEATTAAQLQHPNIVQIFEVGEHDGHPFFSLELVEGGSLADRLNGEPQPPREAAELVRTLAMAVEHAHGKGVVHRDMKPANVLLAASKISDSAIRKEGSSSVETSRQTPKITDFGLAKQQSRDSGLTASGAILGTPSYMAPEQAAGHGADAGPATDVYALGAILYEMLTGRPPFRAATVMDTVLQVMGDEPVPPSRLQPKLPRDLETICLKCLSKKPEQRYETAAALADDLGRFLSGDSILARPTSSLRKLGKWARRYPALAAVVFILAVPLPLLLATMVFLWVQTRQAKEQLETEKTAVVEAHAATDRERRLAQEYLQNALIAMDRILERVGDERLALVPAIQDERAAIMAEALAFFESLLRIDSSDPKVREETAQTFARVARVSLMSGRTEQSAKAAQSSVDLYAELVKQFPDRHEFRNQLASAYMFLGHSRILNSDFDGGLKAYSAGAEIAEALAKEYPNEPAYRATAAECRRSMGYFFSNGTGSTEGESNFKTSLELAKGLCQQHPENKEYQALEASILGAYAQFLMSRNRIQEAAPLVKSGLAMTKIDRKSLPRAGHSRMHLDQASLTLRLASANLQLSQGNRGKSIELLNTAVAEYERMMASQPQSFPYRLQAIQTYTSLARVLRMENKDEEGTKATARIIELSDDMLRDFPVLRQLPRSMWFQSLRLRGMLQHLTNLLLTKKAEEARQVAKRIEESPGLTGVLAYNLACSLAILAELRSNKTEREAEFGQAMTWLRKAEATGYPGTAREIEHVKTIDEDLNGLRKLSEFQEWAGQLKPVKK